MECGAAQHKLHFLVVARTVIHHIVSIALFCYQLLLLLHIYTVGLPGQSSGGESRTTSEAICPVLVKYSNSQAYYLGMLVRLWEIWFSMITDGLTYLRVSLGHGQQTADPPAASAVDLRAITVWLSHPNIRVWFSFPRVWKGIEVDRLLKSQQRNCCTQ